MKLSTTSAIALAAAIFAAPAAAQYGSGYGTAQPQAQSHASAPAAAAADKAAGPKVSDEARTAILELQKAVNANDAATISAKTQAALAHARTKDDRYVIGQLQLKAALASKDDTAIAAAIDTIAGSQYLDAAKVSDLYMGLGVNLYNGKKVEQAAAAFEKAATLNPQSGKPLTMLAEARIAQGRKPEAVAALQRALQLGTAAGQKPEEKLFKRAVGVAYDLQSPAAIDIGRQWIAAYPSPDSWRNAIAIYRNLTKPGVEGTLDLLRLMNATGALTMPSDYQLYAAAAAEQGNFGEAQAIIDQGLAAKHIDPARPDLRAMITGLKNKPKATAADLAVASRTATSGSALIGIGNRYYGLGQYDKALELYRAGLGKPGVDANLANLHIGMALARSGDKAGAAAALKTVTGPLADVAKFWLIYVQNPA